MPEQTYSQFLGLEARFESEDQVRQNSDAPFINLVFIYHKYIQVPEAIPKTPASWAKKPQNLTQRVTHFLVSRSYAIPCCLSHTALSTLAQVGLWNHNEMHRG